MEDREIEKSFDFRELLSLELNDLDERVLIVLTTSFKSCRERLFFLSQCYSESSLLSTTSYDISKASPLNEASNNLDIFARYFALCLLHPETFNDDATDSINNIQYLANCLIVSASQIKTIKLETPVCLFLPLGMLSHILVYACSNDEKSFLDILFKAVSSRAKRTTLVDESHKACLEIINEMIKIPQVCLHLVESPNFLSLSQSSSQYIYGNLLENDTILGPLFRLSSLPGNNDSVIQYFFGSTNNPEESLNKIRSLLRASRSLMFNLLARLLSKGMDQSVRRAMLSWLSSIASSNCLKRRMISVSENDCSSDAFLLNICAVLVKLLSAYCTNVNDLDIEFIILPSILDLENDTRIVADSSEVKNLRNRIASQRKALSEAVGGERGKINHALPRHFQRNNIHLGVFCDACKRSNIPGIRWKCLNCKDYDLCNDCYEKVKKRNEIKLVSCLELKKKVERKDLMSVEEESKMNFEDNSDSAPLPVPLPEGYPTQDPGIHHDSLAHVMLRLVVAAPIVSFRTLFSSRAPFELLPLDDADKIEVINSLDLGISLEDSMVHREAQCSSCLVSPIRGPMFLCVNCVEYTLCSSCHTKEMEEGDNSSTHASAHVFALIHRPISIRISSPERLRDNLNLNTNNDTSSARPLDSLFAVELVVENKHYNFATELYFLTAKFIYVGFSFTASRYLQLLNNSNRILKLSVESMILEDDLVKGVYNFFELSASFLSKLANIDDDANSTVLLNISKRDSFYNCFPKFLINDMIDFLQFLAKASPKFLTEDFSDSKILRFLIVFLNRFLSIDPFMRHKVVCLLLEPSFLHFVVSSPLLIPALLPSLIKYYVEVGTSVPLEESIQMRNKIVLILLTCNSTIGKDIFLFNINNPNEFTKFLHGIVASTQTLSDSFQRQIVNLLDSEIRARLHHGQLSLSLENAKKLGSYFSINMAILSCLAQNEISSEALIKSDIGLVNLLCSIFRFITGEQFQDFEKISYLFNTIGFSVPSLAYMTSYMMQALVFGKHFVIKDSPIPCIGSNDDLLKIFNFYDNSSSRTTNQTEISKEYLKGLTSWLPTGNNVSSLPSLPLPVSSPSDFDAKLSSIEFNNDEEIFDRKENKICSKEGEKFISEISTNFYYDEESFERYFRGNGQGRKFSSYLDRKTFKEGLSTMTSIFNLPIHFCEVFGEFIEIIQNQALLLLEEEKKLGEIPDHFLCPLLSTLMTDPVRMPNGQVIERQTIERYLLTKSENPFTREYLTKEMLTPDDELRNQIKDWVKDKLNKEKA